MNDILIGAAGLLVGLGVGYFLRQVLFLRSAERLKVDAEAITREAKESAKNIELQARDNALATRQKAEEESERRRVELNRDDDRLQRR